MNERKGIFIIYRRLQHKRQAHQIVLFVPLVTITTPNGFTVLVKWMQITLLHGVMEDPRMHLTVSCSARHIIEQKEIDRSYIMINSCFLIYS